MAGIISGVTEGVKVRVPVCVRVRVAVCEAVLVEEGVNVGVRVREIVLLRLCGARVRVCVLVAVLVVVKVDDRVQGERVRVIVGDCDATGVRVSEPSFVRVAVLLALQGERVLVIVCEIVGVCERVRVLLWVKVGVLLRVCGARERVRVLVAVGVNDLVTGGVRLPVRVIVGEGDTSVQGQKRRELPSAMAPHVPTPPPYRHWRRTGSNTGFWGMLRLPELMVQKEPGRPMLARIALMCAAVFG
jgi:hypothetical protein